MSRESPMRWDAKQYDLQHSFVTRLGEGIFDLLDPQPGERILDVGCGTGHLTQAIAAKGADVVGLDNSLEMMEVARQVYPDLEFIHGDIRQFCTDNPFDAIFSNAVLHWVQPPEQAVARMSGLLRAGGRLVVELGGSGNVASICRALEKAVWEATGTRISAVNYFPRISEYTALLEQNGFEVTYARLFDRPTKLDCGAEGIRNWLQLFRRPVMDSLTPEDRAQVIERVQSTLQARLFHDGAWYADYRRLQIMATKIPGIAEAAASRAIPE